MFSCRSFTLQLPRSLLDCYFLPSHRPLLDIALASSLRPPSRLWLPFIHPIIRLRHQNSFYHRRSSLLPAKKKLLYFTLLYFTFLFLLTQFVSHLFHRVGLCSYKYPRQASLKSWQFGPVLLSSCVILSTDCSEPTRRLVFSSRRLKYVLAT